jgi:YVTN family beta-propeller protein
MRSMRRNWVLGLAVAGLACAGGGTASSGAASPATAATPAGPAAGAAAADYLVGVASESGDIVTWLAPRGDSLVVDHVVPVGVMPADIDGPHNVAAAPDQRSYYVTIAHGTPYGTLWRFDAATDTVLGRAPVELFPTTIALTPDGELAFVANSDFHGDRPRVNPVSVVHTPTMTKITDVTACDMPHGVKSNNAGTRVYVSCMHSDEILEMDVSTLGIARRVKVGGGHAPAHAGHGRPVPPVPPVPGASAPEPQAAATAGGSPAKACSPTFVSVSPDDRRLYVACNGSDRLLVLDAATLAVEKEIPTGKGAYNVEPSPDGRWVVVTNKKDQSVSLVDARSLTETARVPTSKKIVHGVAFSPDGRRAYISAESIGADPGAVDVLDLATRKVVASIAVPAQPTGITIRRLGPRQP